MNTQALSKAFDALSTPEAGMAVLPLLTLGVGVVLYLLCDVVPALKNARGPLFVATILASGWAELRVLLAENVPGLVLEGTFLAHRGTALFGLLFLAGALLAWIYSHGYYRENLPFKSEHDALMLTAPAGMMLMVGAGDLIVFFVGLELLSLPLYALCAFRRTRSHSVEAGLKYFLLGSFSSGLFLYGAALVYAAAGTMEIGQLFSRDLSSPLAVSGLALVAASLFFKVSVFPFHLWAPDVYQGSPTPVTALMATGTKAAAFGFLIANLSPLLPHGAAPVVTAIALVTMLVGNLGALVQDDLKRMLAYSSVSHAGTLLLLLAAGMHDPALTGALQAALYYLGGYLFTAMGAFGLLAWLESEDPSNTRLASLRGLGRRRPVVGGLLALFMLSLGGIPATAGFLGKWFVFSALVRADMIGAAIVGALLSTIALGYYLRVIVVLFMQEPEHEPAPSTARLAPTAASLVCGAFVLVLGLLPAPFLHLLVP